MSGPGRLELEPDVGGALVDAAYLGVDDMEAADAAVEVVRPDRPLEAVALVDDLDEEAVVVELGAERDLPFGRGGSRW